LNQSCKSKCSYDLFSYIPILLKWNLNKKISLIVTDQIERNHRSHTKRKKKYQFFFDIRHLWRKNLSKLAKDGFRSLTAVPQPNYYRSRANVIPENPIPNAITMEITSRELSVVNWRGLNGLVFANLRRWIINSTIKSKNLTMMKNCDIRWHIIRHPIKIILKNRW